MNYQKEKMKAIPFKIASKGIAGVEEDSWDVLGQQGDETSQS